MTTVVLGLMRDPQQARAAMHALDAEGFDRREIEASRGLVSALAELRVPAHEAHAYAEGVRRGGTVVCVHAEDDMEAEHAAHLMMQHGAADIEACAAGWKRDGWSGIAQPEPAAAGHYALAFGEYPSAPARMYHQRHARRRGSSAHFPGIVNEGPYSGPERRDGNQPYPGDDRRGD